MASKSLRLRRSGQKRCSKCRYWKQLPEFYRSSGSPDGHQYECKDCQNNRFKEPEGKRVNSYCPELVSCMVCGLPCSCTLDNPYWLNQYSDHMASNQACCSIRCFRRLGAAFARAIRLDQMNRNEDV